MIIRSTHHSINTEEYSGFQLQADIQRILETAVHSRHKDKRFTWREKVHLVRKLIRLYRSTPKEKRGDELVPFCWRTVASISMATDEQSKKDKSGGNGTPTYYIEYKWNGWKGNDVVSSEQRFAEFEEGRFKIGTVIPEGTWLDRVGSVDGSYLCPIPLSEERVVYSVQERAIPYYFEETNIEMEPAYHRYVATCDISNQLLVQRIKDKSEDFGNDKVAIRFAMDLLKEDIVEGYIAPVKTFGKQGLGGGYQYKMPLTIKHLLTLEVIKEV